MTLPSKPLVDGLLSMVSTHVPGTCLIFWAQASTSPGQTYAVFYPDTGTKSAFNRDLLNEGPNELRYQVTSVGKTPEQAAWVADKVSEALLSFVPSVAGRRVWPAIEEGAQPVRRDDEATGLFFATTQYLTRSDPA